MPNRNVYTLDAARVRILGRSGREALDPVTTTPFKVGDEVVFCGGNGGLCQVPHSVASWDMMGGHCSCHVKNSITVPFGAFAPRSVRASDPSPSPRPASKNEPSRVQRRPQPEPPPLATVVPRRAAPEPAPSGCNAMLVVLLIGVAAIAIACTLSVVTRPPAVPVQAMTSPPQPATTEAPPIETPTPLTAEATVEATAAPSETPLADTPSPVAEQLATPQPAMDETATPEPAVEQTATPAPETGRIAMPQPMVDRIATARPAGERRRVAPPATNTTQIRDTPEPVPERVTFVASSSEFTIDHVVASGSEALMYITLRPERDAYFDGSDFELRLPAAAGSGMIYGRSEGAWRLFAGESGQRIVQFDISPNTALAGSTVRWSYHDRP